MYRIRLVHEAGTGWSWSVPDAADAKLRVGDGPYGTPAEAFDAAQVVAIHRWSTLAVAGLLDDRRCERRPAVPEPAVIDPEVTDIPQDRLGRAKAA